MPLLAVPAARAAQPGDVAPDLQWTSESARLPLVLVKVTVYRSGTAVTAIGATATAVAGLSRCYGVVQCSGSVAASASLSVGTVLCSVAGLLLPAARVCSCLLEVASRRAATESSAIHAEFHGAVTLS